jgi:hypothetical protein
VALALLVVVIRDFSFQGSADAGAFGDELLDPLPRIALGFHDHEARVTLGEGGVKPDANVAVVRGTPAVWEPSMRFGLVMLNEKDPRLPDRLKRLTFEEEGLTNNTCLRIDGNEWLFGERPFRGLDGHRFGDWPGRWQDRDVGLGKTPGGRKRDGRKSVWIYDRERLLVTQSVEVVPGEQSPLLDTCLARYRIENQDGRPHTVGLRFLLDTYIGANDGVPFTVPGARELCDTQMEFGRAEQVPDFIQALERGDLTNPGTVAHVRFRPGGGLEAPDRVTLGAWPNLRLAGRDPRCRQEKTLWDVPVLPIKSIPPGDSAVVMYWNEKPLSPGGSREVGFTYGLGSVSSHEGGGRLGLTAGGSFTPGGEFTLTAYVSNPVPDQTVTLELPAGFRLVEGPATQAVPPLPPGALSQNSPVTWRIKAGAVGTYSLRVRSSTGVAQTQAVTIRVGRIFD